MHVLYNPQEQDRITTAFPIPSALEILIYTFKSALIKTLTLKSLHNYSFLILIEVIIVLIVIIIVLTSLLSYCIMLLPTMYINPCSYVLCRVIFQ